MQYKEITDVFEDILKIDFNQSYATRLEGELLKFKTKWIQKDKEHIMMLSSHYTGVYNAVFSSLDMEAFFRIFKINQKTLKQPISTLPNIKSSWQVVTNPMYQLCVWLMHKYIKLGYKNLDRVLTLLYELISYPMLTSILYNFFKRRKQTIEEAKATYEKLNYKFLLKKLGSWDSLIKYKAKTVMKDGRFWEALNKLDTLRSIDIISGIQTSYKSLIINIAGITHTGIAGKIDSSSMIVELPDGTTDIKVIDNATVTVCHSHSKNLKEECREADIIIAAIGRPDFVTADMVKPGAVVIDVGTTRVPDVTKKSGFRLNGDVKFDEVAEKCSFITPVPGGVGPMTICSLMKNTLAAGKKEYYK